MWLDPKTNWQPDDYINASDFNRIRGNIEHLKEWANTLYVSFDFDEELEGEKTYSDIAYASVWNNLENALQKIIDNTYDLNVGDKMIYNPSSSYIDYEELNRLESTCLRYYQMFDTQQNETIETLSFQLGNYGGIKL